MLLLFFGGSGSGFPEPVSLEARAQIAVTIERDAATAVSIEAAAMIRQTIEEEGAT